MWPFKKKKPVEDNSMQEALDALRAFRGIGEKFNYMGVELIVESHWSYEPFVGLRPMLVAAYKNSNGDLKHVEFTRSDLIALRAENP